MGTCTTTTPASKTRAAANLVIAVGSFLLMLLPSASAQTSASVILTNQHTAPRVKCRTSNGGRVGPVWTKIFRLSDGEMLRRQRLAQVETLTVGVRVKGLPTSTETLILELFTYSRRPLRCNVVSDGKRQTLELKSSDSAVSAHSSTSEGRPECQSSDLNGDQVVDGLDLSVLISQFGESSSVADINGDGLVNGLDLSVLLRCSNAEDSSSSGSSSSATSSASSQPEESRPILPEGPGFAGQTQEPERTCSSGFGCTARPAAHWNVVPFQTVTDHLDVGVVAFHVNGVARVSFSLSNGPWIDVVAPSMNLSSGVREYVARLDAAQVSDGTKELRAIVYPHVGTPRVLEPLVISANFGGGLPSLHRFVSHEGSDSHGLGTRESPFKSILRAAKSIQDARGDGRADGGVINLLPGSYAFGPEPGEVFPWHLQVSTANRWLVVRPAPGVSQSEVELTRAHPEGLKTKLVKIEGLTVRSQGNSILTDGGSLQASLWIDATRLIGPGSHINMTWEGYEWRGGKYVTNSHISDARGGIEGAKLQRGVLVERIGSDAFSNSAAVINSEARDIRAPNANSHPDVYQFFRTAPNVVLYGLIATGNIDSQGIFIKDANIVDVAIVDCDIDVWSDDGNQPQPGIAFQVDYTSATSVNHLYISHSNFVGPASWDTRVQTANSVIEQSSFSSSAEWSVSGLQYR